MSKVSIVKCPNYNFTEVESALRRAIDLLGGINSFVKEGQTVLLKPNLLSARPPEDGVDTHPEVLRAVIRLVKGVKGQIIVGDSPAGFGGNLSEEIYEKSGIKKVCREENVELVKFNKITIKNNIPLSTYALECDVLISLPKFKTHNLTTITGGVKNLFGTVPGLRKAEYHKQGTNPKDFASIVVNIYSQVKPHLSIMDGIVAMEGDGPAGKDLRNLGLILASNDAVSMDAVMAKIIGLEPFNIHTTFLAHKRGIGVGDLNSIEILGEKIEELIVKDFKLPNPSILCRVPPFLSKFLFNLIQLWPYIDEEICKKCEICSKSCPQKTITINEKRSVINYKNCIRCLCCYEVCPYQAISIRRNFWAKLARMVSK